MEFREYSNPESMDYDITSSLGSTSHVTPQNKNYYTEQLIDMIGILEDVTEENLQRDYGISLNEYFNPNQDVINKVQQALENSRSRHR